MKIKYMDVDKLTGKPMWVYTETGEEPKVGDTVGFTCNGRGRGGHYRVTAKITKVNPKTLKLIEALNSYSPGTLWNIDRDLPDLHIHKDFV